MSVAMFTTFRALLVQRLPVTDQDRVVVLWAVGPSGVEAGGNKLILDQVRRGARTIASAAGVVHWGAAEFPLVDGDRTDRAEPGDRRGELLRRPRCAPRGRPVLSSGGPGIKSRITRTAHRDQLPNLAAAVSRRSRRRRAPAGQPLYPVALHDPGRGAPRARLSRRRWLLVRVCSRHGGEPHYRRSAQARCDTRGSSQRILHDRSAR